jgi:SAM-dependent methyltransferase
MTASLKLRLRQLVPLSARLRLAAWVTRQHWLPVQDHVAMGLIRDLQSSDPKAFHKFAWSNHLMGYARWYDSEEELFSPEQMQASRIELFRDLASVMARDLALDPAAIESVLEVGCSQGYLLRHIEQHVFPHAHTLTGIDIDAPAVDKGMQYLARSGSRVRLFAGDMERLDTVLAGQRFDITLAAGVLSYLDEQDAADVVSRMLSRTNKLLVLAGLACVDRHNDDIEASALSPLHDVQWVHNFAAMITSAGGNVVRTRWEGARLYNMQTLYFAFATPPPAAGQASSR